MRTCERDENSKPKKKEECIVCRSHPLCCRCWVVNFIFLFPFTTPGCCTKRGMMTMIFRSCTIFYIKTLYTSEKISHQQTSREYIHREYMKQGARGQMNECWTWWGMKDEGGWCWLQSQRNILYLDVIIFSSFFFSHLIYLNIISSPRFSCDSSCEQQERNFLLTHQIIIFSKKIELLKAYKNALENNMNVIKKIWRSFLYFFAASTFNIFFSFSFSNFRLPKII